MKKTLLFLSIGLFSCLNLFSQNVVVDSQGAIIRKDTDKKVIHFIFSGDEAFEGASHILNVLDAYDAKASFFLTGNCLRNEQHAPVVKRIIENGHYLGGHSDNHLLYAPWDDRQKMLVTRDSLVTDFKKNMDEIARWGVDTATVKYFLPPFEWYNKESVEIINELGQEVINYTAGLRTPADYTTPDMKSYKSSAELIEQLFTFEKENGLNGAIILLHPGTHKDRTDKLYLHFDSIMQRLKALGYEFVRF